MTLPPILASGKWFTAAGKGATADVARDDLGLGAATALARASGRKTLTLSGPEALTVPEVAAQLNSALGLKIEVVPVPVEGLIDGIVGSGMPRPMAEMFASFDANTAAGHAGTVTQDLEAQICAPPVPFDAWLDAHRDQHAGWCHPYGAPHSAFVLLITVAAPAPSTDTPARMAKYKRCPTSPGYVSKR